MDTANSYADTLAKLGIARSYGKNIVVLQQGDRTDQIYVVLSGRLKVFLSDEDGKEIIVDTLGAGEFFGEMALDGGARSASVMTTEPSRLSVLEREHFRKFLSENPDSAHDLIVMLFRRMRQLTRMVGSLALLDVYGRVARLLLDNASEEDGRKIVAVRMTQGEIARRVGTTRETVSRILSDLREGNYLQMEDSRIVILQNLPKRW